jgi:hypothetical protein
MPEEFLRLAETTLSQLEAKEDARTALERQHEARGVTGLKA